MESDFNSRVANLNQLDNNIFCNIENIFYNRASKDNVLSPRGRELVDLMEDNGMILLTGRTMSDNSANWTFVGHQGKRVIDLI